MDRNELAKAMFEGTRRVAPQLTKGSVLLTDAIPPIREIWLAAADIAIELLTPQAAQQFSGVDEMGLRQRVAVQVAQLQEMLSRSNAQMAGQQAQHTDPRTWGELADSKGLPRTILQPEAVDQRIPVDLRILMGLNPAPQQTLGDYCAAKGVEDERRSKLGETWLVQLSTTCARLYERRVVEMTSKVVYLGPANELTSPQEPPTPYARDLVRFIARTATELRA